MAQRVMPKDPSKDQAWRQVNTMPVELPPPDTRRWVPRRKAVIVNAVRRGAISLEEVCRRYQLSVEEFVTWQRAIETHGVPGLRVTRLQMYRDARRRATGSRRYAASPPGIGEFR
jgi:transposase-like protein